MQTTIVIPYRDREEHLAKFVEWFKKPQFSRHQLLFIEQEQGKPFNRARLLNIGALIAPSNTTHYVFHDVDLLPLYTVYPASHGVSQFIKSDIQKRYYLGGVTMFDRVTFEEVGGYHNDYFHRAEDNEMMFNLIRLSIPVVNSFCKFIQLPHKRSGPEFIPELWHKAQEPRSNQNHLSSCEFEVVHRSEIDNITHVLVSF